MKARGLSEAQGGLRFLRLAEEKDAECLHQIPSALFDRQKAAVGGLGKASWRS